MSHSAPRYASNNGIAAAAKKALGKALLRVEDRHGEIALHVKPADLLSVMTALRDTMGYQQLMDIAGVDWLGEAPRFEIVYCLLSVTRNHRIRVHLRTEEADAVPSVTGIWPNAGWLEREVFDMYGLIFAGHSDLRRILTDYGFQGHPQRKDFPLTGFTELRWSEEDKRVKYVPVSLAQDFRTFDFESPWEGTHYPLPGDEKAERPDKPQSNAAEAGAKDAAKKPTMRRKPAKAEASQ